MNSSAAISLDGSSRRLAAAPPSSHTAAADRDGLADWFAALRADDPSLYSYLLALRFGIVNLIAIALLGAAWLEGWLTSLVVTDTTHLVAAITGVFIVGLVLCARIALQLSSELNQVKARHPRRGSRVAGYLEAIADRDSQSRAILASSLSSSWRRASRGPPPCQQPGDPRADRHRGRLHHGAVRRRPRDSGRRQLDRADGLDADRRHVGGALHDAGRRGAQYLADAQLPTRGRRHGPPADRDRRAGRAP